MARRRTTGETLHTSLSGHRSVWLGRKPKGEQTVNSFHEFRARAEGKRTDTVPEDNQLHMKRHHMKKEDR